METNNITKHDFYYAFDEAIRVLAKKNYDCTRLLRATLIYEYGAPVLANKLLSGVREADARGRVVVGGKSGCKVRSLRLLHTYQGKL